MLDFLRWNILRNIFSTFLHLNTLRTLAKQQLFTVLSALYFNPDHFPSLFILGLYRSKVDYRMNYYQRIFTKRMSYAGAMFSVSKLANEWSEHKQKVVFKRSSMPRYMRIKRDICEACTANPQCQRIRKYICGSRNISNLLLKFAWNFKESLHLMNETLNGIYRRTQFNCSLFVFHS